MCCINPIELLFFIIFIQSLYVSANGFNSSCAITFGNEWTEQIVGSSCKSVQKYNKTMFCNMINYAVYEKVHNDYLSRDRCAQTVVNEMLKVLNTYDCSRPYGYHNCTHCVNAYKYWICSQVFPRCDSSTKKPIAKTCVSICQDVQRKCPYVLGFKCPNKHTLIASGYSTEKDKCNKMDRTILVDGYADIFPEDFSV
jgi:hypothetical protein